MALGGLLFLQISLL